MKQLVDWINVVLAFGAVSVIAVGAVLLAGGPHFTLPFGWGTLYYPRWYHAVGIFAVMCAALPVARVLAFLADRLE